jgi:hypothetical protein
MSATPHIDIAQTSPTDRFVGRCEVCVRPIAIDDHSGGSDHRRVLCPECRRPVTLTRIYGVVTTMTCHGSCMDAIGDYCECSCGGVNHAGSYVGEGQETADAIERFRLATQKRKAAAAKAAATRAAARHEREAQAAAERLAASQRWRTEHPAEAAWLDANAHTVGRAMWMLIRVNAGEPISDEQLADLRLEMQKDAERKAEEAAPPAPTGVVSVEGEIVSIKVQPSNFHYGSEVKMLVKANGYRVWVTKPRALSDARVGQRVRFTAELKLSSNDVHFVYGSRPRQAEIVPA